MPENGKEKEPLGERARDWTNEWLTSALAGMSAADLREMFQQLMGQIFENWTLRNELQQGDPSVTESLPEETIQQLEALGYLE